MNQKHNNPNELETQLSSIAIDAVIEAMNMNLSPQELQDFKEQTIKNAKAIANELRVCTANNTVINKLRLSIFRNNRGF